MKHFADALKVCRCFLCKFKENFKNLNFYKLKLNFKKIQFGISKLKIKFWGIKKFKILKILKKLK
jgi:hypothetical protein